MASLPDPSQTFMAPSIGGDVTITARPTAHSARVLTPEALEFVRRLHRQFNPTRERLLSRRDERRERIRRGERLDFLAETTSVREAEWRVDAAPPDLDDRRVEITGPVDRKMMINALNSGARVFMADLEDALSPTWENVIEGQYNLIDAVRRELTLDTDDGKHYRLNENIATLVVRPRGWHLLESHVRVDDAPISASLFDFGLYFFHNARELIDRGTGPYFYLPKIESHLEARLWNDVFNAAQDALEIPRGTVRATVLIETILAAFEMEEILFELREHAAGLNAGRWDYLFSIIKTFRTRPDCVLPDRAQLTMTVPFMRAYARLLVARTPRSTRARSPRCATTRNGSPATASTERGSRIQIWSRWRARYSIAYSPTSQIRKTKRPVRLASRPLSSPISPSRAAR